MNCNLQIRISQEVKERLDNLKEYPRETYNDVIDRISKKEENGNGRTRN